MSKDTRLPPGVPLFDANGALSREFLLHRGYCCGNGCRNCPYGFTRPQAVGATPPGGRQQDLSPDKTVEPE